MRKIILFFSFFCVAVKSFASITISPTTLPNSNTGYTYNQQLTASGGTAPYAWTVSAGTIMAGTSVNVQNGIINGVLTATTSTTYTFTIQAQDYVGATGTQSYTVTIAPGSLTIPQMCNLWNRGVPDFGGLNDTYWSFYSTAAGSPWAITGNAGTTAGTNFLGTTDAQDVVIKRNSSEAMRIYSSSKLVGIGTAAPVFDLEVSKNSGVGMVAIGASNTSTTGYSSLNLSESLGAQDFSIQRYNTVYGSVNLRSGVDIYNNQNSFMRFGTNSIERMRILAGGNVGIGTDAPSRKLFVSGSSYVSDTALFASFVGIGTTSPTAILHAVGSATTNATYAGKFENSSNVNLAYFRNDGQTRFGPSNVTAAGQFNFIENTAASIVPLSVGVAILNNSNGQSILMSSYDQGSNHPAISMSNTVGGSSGVIFDVSSTKISFKSVTGTEDFDFINNSTPVSKFYITAAGTIGINNNTPSASVHAIGLGATSATYVAKFSSSTTDFFDLRNDKRIIYQDGNQAAGAVLTSDASGVATWQAINNGFVNDSNSTAGDAATINAETGFFIKDATGTTFTLSNSYVTGTSRILCVMENGVTVTGNLASVTDVYAGGAIITFYTVGVGAAAPASNQRVSFLVLN